MTITREFARALRGEITSTLQSLVAKYGLVVEVGGMSYGPDRVKASVVFSATNSKGESEAARKDWEALRAAFGMAGIPFGWRFVAHTGMGFVVAGINARSRKFPVIVTRDDGVRYKFSERSVIAYWEKQGKEGGVR